MIRGVVVTIDGPAGTGKSSAAAALALRIGFEMLDTGAMYRAVALLAVEHGVDPSDEFGLARIMDRAAIVVDFTSRPPVVRIGDRDVSREVRSAAVTTIVSQIASHQEVRSRVVQAQRMLAETHPRLVTEGRDQGTIVFPDAAVRVWLDARAEVRARRRADELRARGIEANDADVLREILARDDSDRGRSEGPLAQPAGAVVVDTSDMSFDQVVDALVRVVADRTRETGADCHCGGCA